MGIMFSVNQVALLFILLSVTWRVCADDHRSMLVSRGDPIMFCCNISSINATQITWIKGRSYFTHAVSLNQTFSNFSSPRVTIDHNLPTKLSISSAQPEDAGLYTCRVSAVLGFNSMKWNLTVSENPEATHWSWYLVYILTPAIGLLLCGVMSVVCLCRGHWTRTPDEDLDDSNIMTSALYHVQLGGEVRGASANCFVAHLQSYAAYEDKSHRE
ncbi:uncharacterized protein LOC103373482 isoform X4 [Stegastes partitus]|uniref:Uncharacterized protein LOC103373482 isoform X4 n=1 Tax=Stegastes partitus TaxID=144197 RepID=A0A9Y4NQK1_9TELE|nr:PREDICTED: uncharacterized protein LOC103373482 isoform X4 [Stegastes partitus]